MNIKNILALSILLLLGNVQYSQEYYTMHGIGIGILLSLGTSKAYYTFYNTTARQFDNLVIKAATESEHNTKNHIENFLKHVDELKKNTDQKEKVAIMEDAIKCMDGTSIKNAKAGKECIELARKTVKSRKEIADLN